MKQNYTVADEEKLYDLCMIEQLSRNNPEFIRKMVGMFVEKVPKDIDILQEAYSIKDTITLQKTAHRIKPVLSSYLILKIETDIKLIESLSRQGIINDDMGRMLRHIKEVIDKVVEELKQKHLNQAA